MKPATVLAGIAAIGIGLLATAGCTARAGTHAYAGTAPVIYDRPPTLVYVDSGVWVVRDSPYPVYYVDDRYWAYHDDGWYYSDGHGDRWTRTDARYVPGRIVRRDHRHYVHYSGEPAAPTTRSRPPRLAPASRIDRTPRATPPPPPPRRAPALRTRPPQAPPERMRPAPPVKPRLETPNKPRLETPNKPRLETPNKPRLETPPQRTPPRAAPRRPAPSRGDRR